MAKIVKNTTVADIFVTATGVNVPANGQYTIPAYDYNLWIGTIDSQVTAGTFVINDGTSDLSVAQGIIYVNGLPAKYVGFDNSTNGFTSSNAQAAIEEANNGGGLLGDFGDGSDGNVSLSSGTTTLTRTTYYNNLTLSGTASLNPNGWKIYVKGTLNLSGTASIVRTPNTGSAGVGQTQGAGAAAMTTNDMGSGLAGQNGSAGPGGGLGGASGVAGVAAGAATGYGAAGGASGSSGSGTAGAAGTYTNVPERVVRHDHVFLGTAFKNGGQGGAGGAGGPSQAFGGGGGGGGGGSGGGVIYIFARIFINTSSVGIVCKGGNGGAGGTGTGNANGGGGGGGGGGGQIYIITLSPPTIGTLSVGGGTGGAGGLLGGTGSAGNAGSAGSTGHTTVYCGQTSTWTVT